MSAKIAKKIRKEIKKARNVLAGDLLKEIGTWKFRHRLQFAWTILWTKTK